MEESCCGSAGGLIDDNTAAETPIKTARFNSSIHLPYISAIDDASDGNNMLSPNTRSNDHDDESAPGRLLARQSSIMRLRSAIKTITAERRRQSMELKQQKQFVVKEYDWLATVLERTCFILFLLMFIGFTVGINMVGLVYWLNAEKRTLS
jgi:hypothetical protein